MKIEYMSSKWGKLGIPSKINFRTLFGLQIPTPKQKCSESGASVENHIRSPGEVPPPCIGLNPPTPPTPPSRHKSPEMTAVYRRKDDVVPFLWVG